MTLTGLLWKFARISICVSTTVSFQPIFGKDLLIGLSSEMWFGYRKEKNQERIQSGAPNEYYTSYWFEPQLFHFVIVMFDIYMLC